MLKDFEHEVTEAIGVDAEPYIGKQLASSPS
jgi:hypothetical protein